MGIGGSSPAGLALWHGSSIGQGRSGISVKLKGTGVEWSRVAGIDGRSRVLASGDFVGADDAEAIGGRALRVRANASDKRGVLVNGRTGCLGRAGLNASLARTAVRGEAVRKPGAALTYNRAATASAQRAGDATH